MADLKRGDVVRLKSGGPRMTVDHLEANDKVKCDWFKTDGTNTWTLFGREMLNLYLHGPVDEM